MRVERPGVKRCFDLWAETYEATPNPVVELDRRITPGLLSPRAGECVLDAGCGTGRLIPALRPAAVTGIDFSLGMLRVARRAHPAVSFVRADLHRPRPFREAAFDAVLCALVGEHLEELEPFCRELRRVLRPGGRVVFSVHHPAMAESVPIARRYVGFPVLLVLSAEC